MTRIVRRRSDALDDCGTLGYPSLAVKERWRQCHPRTLTLRPFNNFIGTIISLTKSLAPMNKIVLAVLITALPTWVAVAQQSSQPRKNSAKSGTQHRVSDNPCAQYGAGFVKIAGSDICVKIGGSVGVEAGGSARR
jgi:hypothetical protein